MKPRECPHCGWLNSPDEEACFLCDNPLPEVDPVPLWARFLGAVVFLVMTLALLGLLLR